MPNCSSKNKKHPLLISLGNAIKARRKMLKLSQEDLTLISDVDRSYVGCIERGENNVAILTLNKLSSTLELSLEELMKFANL